MENILGYCQPGNFDKKVDLPPPPYDAKITQNTEPLELPLSGNLELSENDVYEALLNHVSKFICYGKGVVKEMIIIKMEQFYAYRHSLETFTENRQVCWSYEPYAGGHIDGPLMKHCYDPWEITVDPLRQFDRHNVKLIMPHTEMLQACPDCGGAGRIECAFCHGKGKMTCNTCNGSGYTFGFSGEDRQMCVHCFSGTVTCAHCKGKGIHGCSICSEAGEIKCYVQLIVHWNNYTDSSLIEHSSDIPKDILKKATGELVYDEINDPKMEERIQRFFKLGFINNIDKFYIFHEAPHGWYLQDWKQFILKFNYIQYRIMPWLLFKQDDQYPTPHPLIKVCSALELPYERIKSRFLWVSSAGISPPKFNENGGDNLNLVVILKNLLLTNSKHFVKTATPGIHINEYEFFEKFIAHNESVEDSIMSDITDLPSKEESFYLEEHADENVREAYKARNKRIK